MDNVDRLFKMYQSSVDFVRPLRTKWDSYYNAYRSFRKANVHPWRSNLFVPYTFSTVEQILPDLVLPKKTFLASPQREDAKDIADMNTDLLQYQWKKAKMDLKCMYWVKSALVYGLGVGKVLWKIEENKKGDIIYDDPIFINVDIMDFFPDPSAMELDLSDAGYVMHRKLMTKREMDKLKLPTDGLNFGDMEIGGNMIPDEKKARLEAQGVSSQEIGKKRLEVLEIWEPDKITFMVVGHGGERKILTEKEYPYDHEMFPFVLASDHVDLHSIYGVGEPESIYSLQMELNDLRNQRMDNVSLVLNRMWEVKKGGQIDPKDLVSKPGNVIWVDQLGTDVAPFKTDDITQSAYREGQELIADINTTTAQGAGARGSESAGSPETAAGISKMSEAVSKRIQLKAYLWELTGLKRVGDMFYALNQQFVDKEKHFRVTGKQGEKFVTMQAGDVQAGLDIDVSIAPPPPENKFMAKAQAMEYYSVMKENPLVDQRKLTEFVSSTFNVPNAEDMLIQEQPMPLEEGLPPQPPQEMGGGGQLPPPPGEGQGLPPQGMPPRMPRGMPPGRGQVGGVNSVKHGAGNLLRKLFGGRRIPSGRAGIKLPR